MNELSRLGRDLPPDRLVPGQNDSLLRESIHFCIAFLFIFFFSTSSVCAASMVISEAGPETLTSGDQEYQATISLSVNAAEGTKYYLGGVFVLQGSSNYCGKTWSAEKSSWVSYTDEANLPVVTIASSSASITLKTRLDTDDNGCQSAGTYTFKVRRYTEGGSASFDEQNEQTVLVALPTLTPTPTRTPSPTPTTKPDPTATVVPTSKPAASPTPTKTPTPIKTATPTPVHQRETRTPTVRNEASVSSRTREESGKFFLTEDAVQASPSTNVLGITDSPSGGTNPFIVGLIAAGGICIGAAGYLMVRARRRG